MAGPRRRSAVAALVGALLLGLVPPALATGDRPAEGAAVPVFDPRPLSRDRFPAATAPEELRLVHAGRVLAARAWLPDTSSDPSWRLPVVLVQTPYWNSYSTLPAGPEVALAPLLTPKGYALVVAEAPGTGRSGGCYDLLGASETGALGAWARDLAGRPWSSGDVALVGLSADGEAALHTATLDVPGVRTVVAYEASPAVYDGYSYLDGVPYTTRGVPVLGRDGPPLPSGAFNTGAYASLALTGQGGGDPRCPADVVANASEPAGTRTPWFRARDARARRAGLRVPVLTWTSYDDPVVLPVGLVDWVDRLPRGSRLVVSKDPTHGYPWVAPEHVRRDDALDVLTAWLDDHLLGLPTRTDRWPAVQLQDVHGAWRTASSWSGSAEPRVLHPGEDGLLTSRPGTGRRAFGETTATSFDTAPLTAPLHLGGEPVLHLRAVLDRPDAHLVAVLQEVAPDGRAVDLSTGALSVPHAVGTLEAPRPAPTGVALDLRLRFVPLEHTLPAGSVLRLVLGGAQERAVPAGTGWSAAAELGPRTRLVLPVVTEECGLVVRSAVPPRQPPAPC